MNKLLITVVQDNDYTRCVFSLLRGVPWYSVVITNGVIGGPGDVLCRASRRVFALGL
jgi:hypothetical protein